MFDKNSFPIFFCVMNLARTFSSGDYCHSSSSSNATPIGQSSPSVSVTVDHPKLAWLSSELIRLFELERPLCPQRHCESQAAERNFCWPGGFPSSRSHVMCGSEVPHVENRTGTNTLRILTLQNHGDHPLCTWTTTRSRAATTSL